MSSGEESRREENLQGRPWIVIGAGRLGRAIGLGASRLGVRLRTTWNRTEAGAARSLDLLDCDDCRWGELPAAVEGVDFEGAVVWLTVVDDAVSEVAEVLADELSSADVVLHTSGSLGVELFEEAGVESDVGGLHPLLAVTDSEAAVERFGDVVWSVEGRGRALAFARAFASEVDAPLFELTTGTRPLYHAAAVVASNLVVALVDVAFEMVESIGLSRTEAREMLLPLVVSSVENLRDQSTEEALSGPVARGDEGTVERHLEALEGEDEKLRAIYHSLTERAREIAERST